MAAAPSQRAARAGCAGTCSPRVVPRSTPGVVVPRRRPEAIGCWAARPRLRAAGSAAHWLAGAWAARSVTRGWCGARRGGAAAAAASGDARGHPVQQQQQQRGRVGLRLLHGHRGGPEERPPAAQGTGEGLRVRPGRARTLGPLPGGPGRGWRPLAAPVARAGPGERGVPAGRPRPGGHVRGRAGPRPRRVSGRPRRTRGAWRSRPGSRDSLSPAPGAGDGPDSEGPVVSWSVTRLLSGGGRQRSVALCQPPPPSVTRTCTSSFYCSASSSLFRVAWIHERVFSFALCLARRRKRRRSLSTGTSFRGERLRQMKARNRMASVMPRNPRNQRVSVNRTVTRKRKAWRNRDCLPLAANPPAEADRVVPVKRQARARVRASRIR